MEKKTLKEFLNEQVRGALVYNKASAVKFNTFLTKLAGTVDKITLSNGTDTVELTNFYKSSGGGRPHQFDVKSIKGTGWKGGQAQVYTGKAKAPFGELMELFRDTKVTIDG